MTEAKKQKRVRESPAAMQAFEDYWMLGPKRSIGQLHKMYQEQAVNGRTISRRTLEAWSAAFGWQERMLERAKQEREALQKAAIDQRVEAAKLRLKRATTLQVAGTAILDKAKISNLSELESRKLLPEAIRMLVEGMKAERIELGEDATNLTPTKPLSEMSDEELDEYQRRLEATKNV